MDGRKEEYHGHDASSQPAFNTPYFESLLQGISVSTSAANSSGVNEDGYQAWSNPFVNTYSNFADWTERGFGDIFPADSSRHTFDLASGGGIASNVPVFGEYYSSESLQDNTDTANPLASSFSGFGGLGINEFRNASDASVDSSAEGIAQQQNYLTKTYDPFGTVPVFCRDSEGPEVTDHSPTLARSSSPSSSKPTYSDVAKNKPKVSVSTASSKIKDPKSVSELTNPAAYLKVPYKKSKSSRGHLNKPKHAADGSVLKPDSKYGLDSFEEPSKILMDRTKRQHSFSGSDSMPPSRKGSTSSLGSASSGLEEFSLKGAASDSKASPDLERKTSESKPRKSTSASPAAAAAASGFAGDSEYKKNEFKKKSKKTMPQSTMKEEKLFFNPKLIFQSKPKPAHKTPETVPNNQQGGQASGSELLNNGKPKSNLYSNLDKSSSTHYINNDLGHGKKQTNMNTHRAGQEKSKTSNMDTRESSCPAAGRSEAPDHSNIFRRKFDNNQGKKTESKLPNTSSRKSKKSKEEPNAFREVATLTCEWTQWIFKELYHILQHVALLVFKCVLLLCLLIGQYILDLVLGLWSFVKSRLPGLKNRNKEEDWTSTSPQSRLRNQGLEENITLPTTGEEAMKRLLACKGKDPFSILGVRSDSTDEQIKRYYRKQAVLVHPDKNQQPGAEEAFKILGHAFELIGEPEKRQKYREARETEAAMQEFADLLSKLHDKMQEAANTMRCDNCGGKHTRVPTDRPFYSARYCDRCNTRHAAKEGDVWAESSVLGFLWHYYACMEGKIYDITEWASCQNTHFKHIQANAHQVIYRIATSANRRHNAQRTNEADLQDFFNNLFQHGRTGEGDKQEGFNYGSGGGTQQNPSSSSAWNTAGRQQKKKKKKRH